MHSGCSGILIYYCKQSKTDRKRRKSEKSVAAVSYTHLVVASKAFPKAGAAMFALISAGGDVGASAGSFVIGSVADMVTSKGFTNARWLAGLNAEQAGLRTGLLIAALFPAMCVVVNVILKKKMQNRDGNL